MADQKISELAAVTSVDDTDEFVLARSGASKKITGANLTAGATTVTVPLTALDLATLNSVPVELVAGPGAGFALVLIAATAFFTNGSTVYDFGVSTSVFLNYRTAEETTAASVQPAESILNASTRGVLPFAVGGSGGSTDYRDAGLEVVSSGSDPSQGDGTLLVAVTYATVEV